MKFNNKKFYELAKQNNFEAADIYYKKNYALSVSVFHGEVDSFTQHETQLLTARGIINGKFGSVTTEAIDKNTPQFLIDSIKRTASVIENDDPSIIFKGSEKYHKKNVFNEKLLTGNIKEKIGILLEIEKKLLAYDKRINEVISVGYDEGSSENYLTNSYGLKLNQKMASYTFYAEVSAKEGEETRTAYKVFESMDENEFELDNFVKDLAEDVLNKLGSTQCKSKKYPVLLNQECFSVLLSHLLSSIDAEEIQKHTSLFEGKLNQQVVSKKLTIVENPLQKGIFFRYFDDEGVATNKKYLIKKGVLQTYLYTLQTAKKDGTMPTGNGYRAGGKASADTSYLVVKPGKRDEKEVISYCKEIGLMPIYIKPLVQAKHIFSHVEWHMHGYMILVEEQESMPDYLFVDHKESEERYPIPAAFESYARYMKIRIGQEKFKEEQE